MNISLNSYPVLLFYAVFGYISTKIEWCMCVFYIKTIIFLPFFCLLVFLWFSVKNYVQFQSHPSSTKSIFTFFLIYHIFKFYQKYKKLITFIFQHTVLFTEFKLGFQGRVIGKKLKHPNICLLYRSAYFVFLKDNEITKSMQLGTQNQCIF